MKSVTNFAKFQVVSPIHSQAFQTPDCDFFRRAPVKVSSASLGSGREYLSEPTFPSPELVLRAYRARPRAAGPGPGRAADSVPGCAAVGRSAGGAREQSGAPAPAGASAAQPRRLSEAAAPQFSVTAAGSPAVYGVPA